MRFSMGNFWICLLGDPGRNVNGWEWGSDGCGLWGRGRRYCVEGAAGGCKCAQQQHWDQVKFGSSVNRRTDRKCLVVGLESRLGSVDGSWCRDARS